MSHYNVFKDKAGEWRFTLVASNGEPVAQSEGYKTRSGATKGVEAAHTAALEATGKPRMAKRAIRAVVKR